MYARRTAAAALAAIGIAASLWAAEPEEKKTPGPEKKVEGPQPAPELDKLNYFAAAWTSEGTMKPGPGGPGGPTQGRAMCRFMPGKFFMGCMMQSKDPAGTFAEVQSMLGWDTEKQVFRSWSFDNHGRFEAAIGTFKDDTWTWIGESHRGVVSGAPHCRAFRSPLMDVHRALDGDQQPSRPQNPGRLSDGIVDRHIVDCSRVEKPVDRALCERQASHVRTNADRRPWRTGSVEQVERHHVSP